MELTELEKALLHVFKESGMELDTAITASSGLNTERQQWMMLGWLKGVHDRTGAFPKQDSICRAVATIRNRFPTPDEEQPEQDPPSA